MPLDPLPVLLVHGLWYRSWALRSLGRGLISAGLEIRYFSYPTLTRTPAENARALARCAESAGEGDLDLVAHSLGGLLTIKMLAQCSDVRARRLVLLGVPLAGSHVARRITDWPGGSVLLGESAGLLKEGCSELPPGTEVGMISGTRPYGLGRIGGGLAMPHDGTVSVAETMAPGLADRIELPVTHTGMLVSRDVALQAAHFLKTGRFSH